MRVTRSRSWLALAGVLGIMALLGATAVTRHHLQMLEHYPSGHAYLTWRHAIHEEGPYYFFWALAIPCVYLFADFVARRHWTLQRTVLAHAAFALAVVTTGLVLPLPSQLLTYCAVLGAVLAYHYSRIYNEREAELANADLRSLRAQLRPHFMFNALNSVAMLVRSGRGPEAVDAIAKVSDLLRDSLDNDERAEVTLEEEVALARRYLAIEEVRFADRLQVRVDLTDEARTVRVPRLVLQPLVENAVRHGIGSVAAAGLIAISGRVSRNELIVSVRDDGPGPSSTERNEGVGLKNTRARLRAAYGSAARLTLEHAPEGGAVATLVIPK